MGPECVARFVGIVVIVFGVVAVYCCYHHSTFCVCSLFTAEQAEYLHMHQLIPIILNILLQYNNYRNRLVVCEIVGEKDGEEGHQ